MKNIILAFVVTVVSIITWASVSAYAAIYYVDASEGNDSNSGTSSAQAWKSLSKVTNSTFSPGDSVLLKRSEKWTESLSLYSSGSENNPINLMAYDTGDEPIVRDITIPGWPLQNTPPK